MVRRKIIAERYIEFFEKLLNEKDLEKQKKIAKEISDFSSKICDEVEEKYWGEPIQEIQNSCLPIEHWKDESGFCDLSEKEIFKFIKQLRII